MRSSETIVVLAEPNDEPQVQLLKKRLQGVRIIAGNSAAALNEAVRKATVLYNCSGKLGLFCEISRQCPNLKWVHSRSVGLERTLFPELARSRIVLTNGRGVFSAALGEFAVGAILYFAKDFRRLIRNQSAEVWEPFDVQRVEGKTVGIVGYGDIGRAIAGRARALGMKVLGLKRHPAQKPDAFAQQIFLPNELLQMIALCDYLVVAAPLTAETRGMIGRMELAAMKRTAVLINLGRGPVVDEGELVNALAEKSILGAALDVFDEEPLPKGHPLYRLDNVLLSPHCADNTPDWLDNATLFFAEQFERYQRGENLHNVVDKSLGY
jgi:phosphoglycerate dehydrogenase-like enzyme